MPELASNNDNERSGPTSVRRPKPSMHAGKCSICRHPQRAEIESAFLEWIRPWDIAREYGLGSRTAVYRHAHALGLFERRDRAVRFALGRLIERVDEVKPTAAGIVAAIRLLAKLTPQAEPAAQPEIVEQEDLSAVSDAGESRETGAGDGLPAEAQSLAPAPQVAPSTGNRVTESGSRAAASPAAQAATPTPENRPGSSVGAALVAARPAPTVPAGKDGGT
jgi:hypothetical protein